MNINKDITSYTKGLSIILIIVGHIYLITSETKNAMTYIAVFGVAMFLSISGYGLVKSYEKNGLNNYFKKKVTDIYLPYLFITCVWILISYFTKIDIPLKNIIMAGLAVDYEGKIDPTMWYITYIFIWYIFFYIAFKLKIKNLIKLLIILSLSIFYIYMYNIKLPNFSWNFATYSLFFPFGIAFGIYEKNTIAKIKNTKINLVFSIIIVITSIFLLDKYLLKSPEILALSGITMITGMTIIFSYLNFKNIRINILKIVGDNSYYIYLAQGYFLFTYNVIEKINNKTLGILVYLVIVTILTLLIKFIDMNFIKKIIK